MISFREVEIADAELIIGWRTKQRVTKFMLSDIDTCLDSQKMWLASCFEKLHYYHWIIQYNGKDVGLINFTNWQPDEKHCSWGFYIGDDDALGIGGFVPPYFYNFAFEVLNVEIIRAEVFYTNVNTIKLHLSHGYHFDPSRDEVIQKGKHEILVVGMNLDRSTFSCSRFASIKADFPVQNWKAKPLWSE